MSTAASSSSSRHHRHHHHHHHRRSPTTTTTTTSAASIGTGNANASKNGPGSSRTIVQRRHSSKDGSTGRKEEIQEIQIKTLSSSGGGGAGRRKEGGGGGNGAATASGPSFSSSSATCKDQSSTGYSYSDPYDAEGLTQLLQEQRRKLQQKREETQKGSGRSRGSGSHHHHHHHHHRRRSSSSSRASGVKTGKRVSGSRGRDRRGSSGAKKRRSSSSTHLSKKESRPQSKHRHHRRSGSHSSRRLKIPITTSIASPSSSTSSSGSLSISRKRSTSYPERGMGGKGEGKGQSSADEWPITSTTTPTCASSSSSCSASGLPFPFGTSIREYSNQTRQDTTTPSSQPKPQKKKTTPMRKKKEMKRNGRRRSSQASCSDDSILVEQICLSASGGKGGRRIGRGGSGSGKKKKKSTKTNGQCSAPSHMMRRMKETDDPYSPSSFSNSSSPGASSSWSASSGGLPTGSTKRCKAGGGEGEEVAVTTTPEEIQWTIQYNTPAKRSGESGNGDRGEVEVDGEGKDHHLQSFTSNASTVVPSSSTLSYPSGSRTTTATMTFRLSPTSADAMDGDNEEEGESAGERGKKRGSARTTGKEGMKKTRGKTPQRRSSSTSSHHRHHHHHHHHEQHQHRRRRSSASSGSGATAPPPSSSHKLKVYAELIPGGSATSDPSLAHATPLSSSSSRAKNKKKAAVTGRRKSRSPSRSPPPPPHHHHHHHHPHRHLSCSLSSGSIISISSSCCRSSSSSSASSCAPSPGLPPCEPPFSSCHSPLQTKKRYPTEFEDLSSSNPRRKSSITLRIRRGGRDRNSKKKNADGGGGGASGRTGSSSTRSVSRGKNKKSKSSGNGHPHCHPSDSEEEGEVVSSSPRRGKGRRPQPPKKTPPLRHHHHHHHNQHRCSSVEEETTITFSTTETTEPAQKGSKQKQRKRQHQEPQQPSACATAYAGSSPAGDEQYGGVTTIVISKQQQEKRQQDHSRNSNSRTSSRTTPPSRSGNHNNNAGGGGGAPPPCAIPGVQGQYIHDVDLDEANKQKLQNLKMKAACLAHEDYIYDLHAPTWAETQQKRLFAAHEKASHMLAALEKGSKWMVTDPFELSRLMRLCNLELSFHDLVKPSDKPQYLEIIALRRALTELKQHPKKTTGVSLTGTIDNALSRLETTEEELRRSQYNAVCLGRAALPVVKGLEDCLNTPCIERGLQNNEDRIAAQLDAIKASTKLRDAALADGEMGIAEEQYYVKGQLLEHLLELIKDKFRLIAEHESATSSMESMEGTRQRALEEIQAMRVSNHRLRDRCEQDMKNLQKAINTADVADAEAAQGYQVKREESEQILAENIRQQQDMWRKVQELELGLQRLGEERLEEVKRRIDAHDREEKRHVEYQQFLDVCDQHKKVLEATMYNCEVGNRCAAVMEKMICETCKTVQSRVDKGNEELAEVRIQVHIEYLEAFRRLYKTLGQLLYKKEKRIEEIDRQLRTTHIQLEFAIETFDPNAKKHSDTKKELHQLRAHVEGEVELLKEKITQALENFAPTEVALNQAGIKYKHPVDEVEDINLTRRSKMVEYRAHLAKQEEDRIRAEREEIRRAKKLQEEQQRQRSVLQITQN